MAKKEALKRLNRMISYAADILAAEKLPHSWANYVGSYHGTLIKIKDALNGEGYSAPYWTEGRGGEENWMGMMDAIHDAEKARIDVLIVRYGAISDSSGAHNAAHPANWEGWPSDILLGDDPWREMRKQGYRPTECDLACDTARWVAEDPERRTRAITALRGHYGQCRYMSVFVVA